MRKALTPEQQKVNEASVRFREHFGLGEMFWSSRADGLKVVSWRRPEAIPANYEFVTAGVTYDAAMDNAVRGQRLCNAARFTLQFECVLEQEHSGQCQPAIRPVHERAIAEGRGV